MKRTEMMKVFLVGLAAALTLSGCANAPANVAAGTTVVNADVAKAIQLYGIVKGAAIAAAAANPSLAPTINADIAQADTIVAALTAAVPMAETDVSSAVAVLTADANALLLVAAPAVKVVKG
jgi:hypothetical protein